MNRTSSHLTGTSNHHTGKLFRSAAILGIAVVGGIGAVLVGSTATAPVAGAVPICPRFTTCPPVTPTTRPPVLDPGVLDPGNGTVDPGAGTPPSTTPPTTTPPTSPTNGASDTQTDSGNAGGGQASTNESPTPTAETAPADENAASDNGKGSSGSGNDLPIIAIVGGIAALGAAGTGLYLRYGRRV